jgi:transcriptional regulator with XRE-family HTH domain
VGYLKNKRLIKRFGDRLKSFRISANLSLQQVHLASGLSKRQITYTESGNINTSISHLALYAELFGVELHELLNFSWPIPNEASLRLGVKKFLKSQGQDPVMFFKPNEGATNVIENKLLKTTFLNSPRFAAEIGIYCKEKYNVVFTTTRISKVLDNLYKKGAIQKVRSEKRTKYRYQRK